MNKGISHSKLTGKLYIPPSKSDAQRALLAAALSNGTSTLRNIGESDDVKAMLSIIQLLGVNVNCEGGECKITGKIALNEGSVIDCHESGLTARLMIAQAVVAEGEQTITGSGSILRRSQKFILEDLKRWGINFASNENALPISISGVVNSDQFTVNGTESSQFVSGLLMAIPLLQKKISLKVKQATSLPYIKMTLNTLNQFGIEYSVNDDLYQLSSANEYRATCYTVEGDWSAASFWIVANALGHRICLQGLAQNSLQADMLVIEAVRLAGSDVHWSDGGLTISESSLRPFTIDCSDAPDLFPPLVALAVHCKGISQIKGVHRLLNKESDRSATLIGEFSKLGADIRLKDDYMLIHGGNSLTGGKVSSNNDHRIAMSLAIAGTLIKGGIEIEHAEAVTKSYPTFWIHFDQLNGGAH